MNWGGKWDRGRRFLAAGLIAVPLAAVAEEAIHFDSKAMVPLIHGPTWVDLDGDGRKDLVMKSRVTINNGHSFSNYTFHVYAKPRKFVPGSNDVELLEPKINWYAVTFPDRNPPLGEFQVSSYQGADCLTKDVRLVVQRQRNTPQQTYLIEAARELGESYSDPAPVTFTVYRLVRASSAAFSEFAFIKERSIRARKSYCSVNNAFREELGLPGHDPAFAGYDYEP